MLDILAQTTQPALDALQILKEVHAFFDAAWTKLIFTLTAVAALLTAILGILVPWLLERGRRQTFKTSQDAILRDMEKMKQHLQAQTNKDRDSMRTYVDTTRDKLKARMDDDLYKTLRSFHLHLFTNYSHTEEFALACNELVTVARLDIEAGNYAEADASLRNAINLAQTPEASQRWLPDELQLITDLLSRIQYDPDMPNALAVMQDLETFRKVITSLTQSRPQ